MERIMPTRVDLPLDELVVVVLGEGRARSGWKNMDRGCAVMMCRAGKRGYMKRTSL